MSLAERIPEVICACCIIHNFLLQNNADDYDDGNDFQIQNDQENAVVNEDYEDNERYAGGVEKRNYITTLLR